jgi:anti-repressor protein
MNEINPIVFTFESKHIRTVVIHDEPWCVAKDVSEALGYQWDRHLVDKVPSEWKGVKRIPTPGGIQDVICLCEQGLYFFLARSDKPAALPFQKWIAGEVIPAIRKTGFYSTATCLPKTFSEALRLAADQAEQIELLKPKALFYDRAMNSVSWFDMQTVAAVIAEKGYGRNNLFRFLIMKGVLIDAKTPYREQIDLGRFKTIEEPYKRNGNEIIGRKIVVSQKGIDFIIRLLIVERSQGIIESVLNRVQKVKYVQ